MINVSEWTIFIDDTEGELAMEKREDATGRTIDVLAKEEIMPKINELKDALAWAIRWVPDTFITQSEYDKKIELIKKYKL